MSKKSRDVRRISLSDFYCTCCGNKGIPLFRVVGKEREPGHLKKIFCLSCQKDVNMVEVKPAGKYSFNNFLTEFNYGNFDEYGNRINPWKQFCLERGN